MDNDGFEGALAAAIDDVIEERLPAPVPAKEVESLVPVPEPDLRPAWLSFIPSGQSIRGTGRLGELAFKGLSEAQIAIRLKYGYDHIKTIATVNTFFSIRRWGVEGLFRPMQEALKPQVLVTETLLQEMAAANSLGDMSEESLALTTLLGGEIADSADFKMDDLDEMAAPVLPRDLPKRPPMDFFKVVLKAPNRIKGQKSDVEIKWKSGEIVVIQQPFCHVDPSWRVDRDCFLYTDPGSRERDLQLLSPGDNLLARLMVWQPDPQKYFWSASLEPKEECRRGAMETLKILMDMGAIGDGKGDGVMYNVANGNAATIMALEELVRLNVAVCLSRGGDVSSWQLLTAAADKMEPITRLFTPYIGFEHVPRHLALAVLGTWTPRRIGRRWLDS